MAPTVKSPMTPAAAAAAIDAEFRHVPGLRLTAAQVRRLCNVSPIESGAALDLLLATGRIVCDATGQYALRESATDPQRVLCASARGA